MHKYYLAMMTLSVVVVGSVIYGFSLAGSPINQKNKNEDSARLAKMVSLKYPIERYYEENKKLPENLNQLIPKQISQLPVDPNTNKPFDYNIKDGTTYSLCTTFLTDNTEPQSDYIDYYGSSSSNNKHAKGYSCLDFKISSYIVSKPTPTIRKEPALVIFGTVNSVAPSDMNPRIIIDDNKIMKIISLTETEILNQDGKKINLNQFQTGDKIIADVRQITGGYNNYTGIRLQNLSR